MPSRRPLLLRHPRLLRRQRVPATPNALPNRRPHVLRHGRTRPRGAARQRRAPRQLLARLPALAIAQLRPARFRHRQNARPPRSVRRLHGSTAKHRVRKLLHAPPCKRVKLPSNPHAQPRHSTRKLRMPSKRTRRLLPQRKCLSAACPPQWRLRRRPAMCPRIPRLLRRLRRCLRVNRPIRRCRLTSNTNMLRLPVVRIVPVARVGRMSHRAAGRPCRSSSGLA
jgi:hypothetical protein